MASGGRGKRLFESLADDLRKRKDSFPGGRLDTIQALARDAGVSKATMQKAMDSLREKGLLESYRGKGTFWVGAEGDPARPGEGNSLATLSEKLRDRILDGTYRVGQALPKVGFLSSQEGVSPDTVCAAFKVLEGESLIRKHGKSWLAGGAGSMRSASPGPSHRTPRNAPAILLLVPDYPFWEKAYHDEHPAKFVQNFYLEIERMGMETHLATVSPSDSGFLASGRPRIQALIQSLGDRYQGAMYIARDAEPGLLSWLGRFKRPVVWLDLECLVKDLDMRSIPGGSRLFRCLKDEEAAVSMALETLAGLGHRRIGFPIYRSPEFPWVLHRSAVLRERAASFDPPLAIIENEHKEAFWHPKPWLGPEDFPVWLAAFRGSKDRGKRKPLREMIPSLMDMLDKDKAARFGGPVTAILAPNDYFAHQYYLWFREMGLRVPGDVTLLSFDNNHWSRPFSISSIDFGFSDLSYQVAHIFLGDIPVRPDALHNLRSRPVLMGRDTLGSLKGGRAA
jgi:DNA-binding transcriptional regulator YhcF (GntR family)/DNA-binding LacI/PurR family transcriptional regulator